MTDRFDVGVVGAGPAGLAAAWTLVEAGAHVRLYERRDSPGGRLRSDELDGARVDPAVQLLASSYRETFRLAEAAGVAELLTAAPGRDALWRRGRPHRITYGSITSMTASTALPARLKLRLATRYLPFLRRHADALDLHDPAGAAAAGLDRESAGEWGARELGEDFVELLAYPLLGAYYGAEPEEVSAGLYHALARAGLDVRVYGVRGGMGELAGGLLRALTARGVTFHAEADVRAVEADPAGVTLRWSGGEARHAAAVVAVPAPVAREIFAAPPAVRAALDAIHVRPTVTLALLLDRAAPGDYFGLSFPRDSPPGDRIVAVCVQERKASALVPEGRSAVVVLPAPRIAPELVGLDPETVLERLLPALEAAWPGVRRSVVRAKTYGFPRGYTVPRPGDLGRAAGFADAALPPRVALAGDYRIAPTVEGAVRSGRRAAERVLRERGG